jgi:hypothetical protein
VKLVPSEDINRSSIGRGKVSEAFSLMKSRLPALLSHDPGLCEGKGFAAGRSLIHATSPKVDPCS